MNNAIPVAYYWEGAVLPSRAIQFTISVQCLREKIADMKRKGARIKSVLPFESFERIERVEAFKAESGHENLNIVLQNGNRVKVNDYRKGDIA